NFGQGAAPLYSGLPGIVKAMCPKWFGAWGGSVLTMAGPSISEEVMFQIDSGELECARFTVRSSIEGREYHLENFKKAAIAFVCSGPAEGSLLITRMQQIIDYAEGVRDNEQNRLRAEKE